MIRLVLLVGISGSGKSTIAKKLKTIYDRVDGQPCVIVSSDEIRAQLLGDASDQSANDKVFGQVHKIINNNLSKRTVIVDATNIKIKSRKTLLDIGKHFPSSKKIALVVTTPLQIAKSQNQARDRVVPEFVLEKQVKEFQIPFYEEGFDEISFVGWDYSKEDFGSLSENDWVTDNDSIFSLMRDFDQKNLHHVHTLNKHCLFCAEKIKEFRPSDKVLYRAALIHDIGKLFTGEQVNDNGDFSYLQHENVGTYTLLQNLDKIGFQNFDDILKTLFYVNYHMLPFSLNTEKAKNKWKNIMGEENLETLFLLNKCDKFATGRTEV